MFKRWLTIKDFEEEFGVASSTQAKMRKEKVLPYSKLGGFVFYDRHLIDKVLEDHTIGAMK
jgi:hypothetical protein